MKANPLIYPLIMSVCFVEAKGVRNSRQIHWLGESLQITEIDELNNTIQLNYFFTPEDAYFWDTTLGTHKLRGIPYTYEKSSSAEASLFLNQDFGIVTHQITFASFLEASSTWEDAVFYMELVVAGDMN